MRKQFVALVVLFFCVTVVYADDSAILEAVEKSARDWLVQTDNGKYIESWNKASALLQAQQPEPAWVKKTQSFRAPFGTMTARYIAAAGYIKAPSGFPSGDYIIVQFYTTFANNKLASETITLAKEKGETWQVIEYEIK